MENKYEVQATFKRDNDRFFASEFYLKKNYIKTIKEYGMKLYTNYLYIQ